MEYGNEEVLSEICVLCMKYEYKEFISEIRILEIWNSTKSYHSKFLDMKHEEEFILLHFVLF